MRRPPDGLTVIAGIVLVRRAPLVHERAKEASGCFRKDGFRRGEDGIRENRVAEFAKGKQGGGQAPVLDFRRDGPRDGLRSGDGQSGLLTCGNIPKIQVVEGLPRKQAGLAGRAGFVPVGQ